MFCIYLNNYFVNKILVALCTYIQYRLFSFEASKKNRDLDLNFHSSYEYPEYAYVFIKL